MTLPLLMPLLTSEQHGRNAGAVRLTALSVMVAFLVSSCSAQLLVIPPYLVSQVLQLGTNASACSPSVNYLCFYTDIIGNKLSVGVFSPLFGPNCILGGNLSYYSYTGNGTVIPVSGIGQVWGKFQISLPQLPSTSSQAAVLAVSNFTPFPVSTSLNESSNDADPYSYSATVANVTDLIPSTFNSVFNLLYVFLANVYMTGPAYSNLATVSPSLLKTDATGKVLPFALLLADVTTGGPTSGTVLYALIQPSVFPGSSSYTMTQIYMFTASFTGGALQPVDCAPAGAITLPNTGGSSRKLLSIASITTDSAMCRSSGGGLSGGRYCM